MNLSHATLQVHFKHLYGYGKIYKQTSLEEDDEKNHGEVENDLPSSRFSDSINKKSGSGHRRGTLAITKRGPLSHIGAAG